jgi:hypothetical protein
MSLEHGDADLPTSLKPTSLMAGEAGDLRASRDPSQAPCFSRPGFFLLSFGPNLQAPRAEGVASCNSLLQSRLYALFCQAHVWTTFTLPMSARYRLRLGLVIVVRPLACVCPRWYPCPARKNATERNGRVPFVPMRGLTEERNSLRHAVEYHLTPV